MGLRKQNRLREVRDDQCRCRRCLAPILLTTYARFNGKCANCIQVPKWAYLLGIQRRTQLFVCALLFLGGSLFHLWNLYDWGSRWSHTFAQHPILYSAGVLLALSSFILLAYGLKSGRRGFGKSSSTYGADTENSR